MNCIKILPLCVVCSIEWGRNIGSSVTKHMTHLTMILPVSAHDIIWKNKTEGAGDFIKPLLQATLVKQRNETMEQNTHI